VWGVEASLVGVGAVLDFLVALECIFLAFLLALAMKLCGYLRLVRERMIVFSSSARRVGLQILKALRKKANNQIKSNQNQHDYTYTSSIYV